MLRTDFNELFKKCFGDVVNPGGTLVIKQSTIIMQPCITTAYVCSMCNTTGVSQMWVSELMGGGLQTPLLVNAVSCKWTTDNQL